MFDMLPPTPENLGSVAQPGDGEGFTQRLAAAFKPEPFVERVTDIAKRSAAVAGKVAKTVATAPIDPIINPEGYRDLFLAADRSARLTGNMMAEEAARSDVYDNRISVIKGATGVELQNPENGGYTMEATRRMREAIDRGDIARIDARPADFRRQVFEDELAALRDKHPDQAETFAFGDVGGDARVLARQAHGDYARMGGDLNPVASGAFGFAGALTGQRRDPLFVASLLVGPTTALGKAVVTRIATSGMFQGLFNAGLSAVEQPAVQAWRAKIGLESGVVPALEEVGFAYLGGQILGSAFRGVREMAAPVREAIERVRVGSPEPGDVETALKAVRGEITPQDLAVVRQAEESIKADRVAFEPKPRNVSPDEHTDAIVRALRHAEDPVGEPPPPSPGPRTREPAAAAPAEETYTLTPASRGEQAREGDTFAIAGPDGKPLGSIEAVQRGPMVEVRAVLDDPSAPLPVEAMQGLMRQLREHYPDSSVVSQMGEPRSAMPWPARADTLEGVLQRTANDPIGTIDALRADPALLRTALASEYEGVRSAGRLATLSDEAWDMVRTGRATPQHAVAVAELAPDPLQHASALRYVTAAKPESLKEARLAAADALEASAGSQRTNMLKKFLDDIEAEAAIRGEERMHRVVREAAEDPRMQAVRSAREALDAVGADQATETELRLAVSRLARESYGVRLPKDESEAIAATIRAAGPGEIDQALAVMAADLQRRKPSTDIMDMVPITRDDGTPAVVSRQVAAAQGEREAFFSDLVKACK